PRSSDWYRIFLSFLLIVNTLPCYKSDRWQGGIMGRRILFAAVLSAIAMFLWTSVAHIVLPLGEIGVQEIPNEKAALDAVHASLGDKSGLYFYPGTGLPPDASREQKSAAMQQYDQKLATSPSGLLIYHPPGAKGLTPGRLATEFLTELVEALL